MLRLMWHIIPEKKSIRIWLTFIYWIGTKKSYAILKKVWIEPMNKVVDLTDKDEKKIVDELWNHIVENDLRREVQWHIKRLKEIKCYRWMRHNLWLPTRWQSTRKNARTAKKLMWRKRVRPVLKK